MRTCQSCGAENPPDRDFCSCGEYLRWEPTGYMQAVTPEMAAQASADAGTPSASPPQPPTPEPGAAPPPPTPTARVTPAVPVEPESGNGQGQAAAAPPPPPPPPTASSLPAVAPQPAQPPAQPVAKTLVRGAVPAQAPAAAPEHHEPATIVLRLPEGDPAKGETLHQAVEPGQRDRVLALVRNQSGIVDNYDLRVEGLPDDWWSIYPGTVYLVPFGSGGTYEQEVEVHLHPPKGPEAEARVWDLRIVADSKAQSREAASAPLALHIQPYIETATTLRPQRKKGRRKADFDVTVANRANAPVLVALDGEDPDGELQFGFNRPPQEIPAGGKVTSQMRVKPPKQIWLGRPQERRLEVKTVTGEEAAARAAAEPLAADVLSQEAPPTKRRWWKRRQPNVPGVYGPRIYKPQLYPPDVNVGPGGLQVRMPQFRAPQVQGPQMSSFNASQLKGNLKMPGRGAATPTAPLLPTQGVFRQRPWLPWWLLPLVLLLLLLGALIWTTLLPKNVVVPNLVGEKSAFAAEEKLTKAELKLDPNQKTQIDDKAPPGSVLKQTPPADDEAEKGTPVTVLLAVRSGKVNVPKIVGATAGDAEKILRAKQLTLGQASPQPVKEKEKIVSQIPAENEIVKRGTPINFFYKDPADAEARAKKKAEDEKNKKDGKAVPGGAAGAKDIVVPAIGKDDVKAYAKKAADLGIVPETANVFNDAPRNKLFATDPPGGTKVAAGSKLKLLVSLGQPEVVFSNEKDILRVDGRTAKKLDPIATGPQAEDQPTWSADGTRIAYVAEGRVMLKDITKKNAAAVPLTDAGGQDSNLAWAPTADVNVMAFNRLKDGDSDLCLGKITGDGMETSCIPDPSFSVGRAIHWSTNGRQILGFAGKNDGSAIGIVRWRVKKGKPAFSTDEADWSQGRFVSDISKPGKGMIDAALSPDGKQLAMISNQGSSTYRLWLSEDPTDFVLSSARQTAIRACKLAWRGDGKELLVIQADAGCGEDVGSLARVTLPGARSSETLNAAGDDPVYQPFTLGG